MDACVSASMCVSMVERLVFGLFCSLVFNKATTTIATTIQNKTIEVYPKAIKNDFSRISDYQEKLSQQQMGWVCC